MSKNEFIKLIYFREEKMVLSRRKTAAIFGVSTETLDRMRKDSQIVSVRIRGQIMFRLDEIYACMYG